MANASQARTSVVATSTRAASRNHSSVAERGDASGDASTKVIAVTWRRSSSTTASLSTWTGVDSAVFSAVASAARLKVFEKYERVGGGVGYMSYVSSSVACVCENGL